MRYSSGDQLACGSVSSPSQVPRSPGAQPPARRPLVARRAAGGTRGTAPRRGRRASARSRSRTARSRRRPPRTPDLGWRRARRGAPPPWRRTSSPPGKTQSAPEHPPDATRRSPLGPSRYDRGTPWNRGDGLILVQRACSRPGGQRLLPVVAPRSQLTKRPRPDGRWRRKSSAGGVLHRARFPKCCASRPTGRPDDQPRGACPLRLDTAKTTMLLSCGLAGLLSDFTIDGERDGGRVASGLTRGRAASPPTKAAVHDARLTSGGAEPRP